jgi:hypothetical protein
MKDEDDGPALGEVRLGHECEHGYRPALLRLDDGTVESRLVRRISGAQGSTPPGDYLIEETRPDGTFKVGSVRGPARVSSRAYRSGWDSTYGRYQGKSS